MYPIGYIFNIFLNFYTQSGNISNRKELGEFIKKKRKQAKLTQPELAERAEVGLRFLRELESNKPTYPP